MKVSLNFLKSSPFSQMALFQRQGAVAQLLSHVHLFATPWTVACQAPLSMEFSRQEYWSGLPVPTLGYLSDPRIEPTSLVSLVLADRLFTTVPPVKSQKKGTSNQIQHTRTSVYQFISQRKCLHSSIVFSRPVLCSGVHSRKR